MFGPSHQHRPCVTAGLDPAIHLQPAKIAPVCVDARNAAGHDEVGPDAFALE